MTPRPREVETEQTSQLVLRDASGGTLSHGERRWGCIGTLSHTLKLLKGHKTTILLPNVSVESPAFRQYTQTHTKPMLLIPYLESPINPMTTGCLWRTRNLNHQFKRKCILQIKKVEVPPKTVIELLFLYITNPTWPPPWLAS